MKTLFFAVSAYLALPVALVACTTSTAAVHEETCDARSFAQVCTDYQDVPANVSYQSACSGLTLNGQSGRYADNTVCSRVDVLGGCQTTKSDGSKATVWMYKSSAFPDADAAKQVCTSDQTFVAP